MITVKRLMEQLLLSLAECAWGCLDQRGDKLCDSLGHLRLEHVEVHPELRPFDPFTVARSISNSSRSPGTKICRASAIQRRPVHFP
jgi:hypothetical protein